mgnify:CR=1 FL=1
MSEQTNNSEYNTVTLSLDDGTECECAIIRIFPAGENDYIALLPLEGEAAEQDEVYLLPDRRDARTRPRVGPPRLHGRQGHRRLEAGLVHPDDEAGDLVHRHGIAPSRPSRVEASHLHRAASRPEGRRPHQGVPADRHHRPSHPGVLPLRASPASLVPRAVARAARGDQPEARPPSHGIEQGDWVWIETEWGKDPRSG